MARTKKDTAIRTNFAPRKRPVAFVVWAGILTIVVVGGAIYLGKSDEGQIDVTSAIQTSNQNRIETGDTSIAEVNAVPEVFQSQTNGGLVPQGETPAPEEVVQEEVVEESATSTEEEVEVPAEPAPQGEENLEVI